MALKTNINGDTYDDTEPCFVQTTDNVQVYDRVRRRWVTVESLERKAKTLKYKMPAKEIGIPSKGWRERYMPNYDFPEPEEKPKSKAKAKAKAKPETKDD